MSAQNEKKSPVSQFFLFRLAERIFGSSSDCAGWEIIVAQIRWSVLRVVKIFVPGPIFGIVDDIIPDATRRCRGDIALRNSDTPREYASLNGQRHPQQAGVRHSITLLELCGEGMGTVRKRGRHNTPVRPARLEQRTAVAWQGRYRAARKYGIRSAETCEEMGFVFIHEYEASEKHDLFQGKPSFRSRQNVFLFSGAQSDGQGVRTRGQIFQVQCQHFCRHPSSAVQLIR